MNIRNRPKPIRIFISIDKRRIIFDELNHLFVSAGYPSRKVDKLQLALQHSILCLSARTFGDKKLVGFVRVTSDEAFNATVWDLIVDPKVANPSGIKKLLVSRLKREIKKIIPQCTLAMFANAQDHGLLFDANFAEPPKGIRAMILG
ncbi:MAG: hypothetical protein AAGG02_02225 [Cyanobacteria bacterium P01_H01_bin.15]